MSCRIDELNPEARAALQAYLDAVAPSIDEEFRDLVLCDLRSWIVDHLDPGASPADVAALTAQAGPMDGEPYDGTAGDPDEAEPADLLGRVASSLWSPADPRLFLPRTLGWGWDLNLGAVAVRLGLIEPDAEAVPFTATPERAFRVAALAPAGLAAAVVAHYLVRGRSLAERLPSHWGLDGSADRWTSKRSAALTDLALSVGPAAVATWAAGSARPGPDKAGAIAGGTLFATAAAVTTVWRSARDRRRAWAGPALAVAVTGAAGAVLFGLARAGRAAEIRRDLASGDGRGWAFEDDRDPTPAGDGDLAPDDARGPASGEHRDPTSGDG